MADKIYTFHPNKKARRSPFTESCDLFRLHRALCNVARAAGKRLEKEQNGSWEGQSLGGDHVWSRNDLEATAHVIHYVAEVFAEEGLKVDMSFENEEIPLVPLQLNNSQRLRLIFDPIDGSKAFDNWKCDGDCPSPPPGSAVSIAAVCPVTGEIVASALYCFDLGEVFSSVYLGRDKHREPKYAAFRNNTLLLPIPPIEETKIEAKRRVLCGNYNSKALVEIARLELALMEKGLKCAFGGLTGSTSTDIINVVRGSFCACLDVRAVSGKEGSVPYFYDAAGALPIAIGRGLRVIMSDSLGRLLAGGNHDIYTPISFMVARPELADLIVDAIRATLCPGFLKEEAIHAAV